MAKAKKKIKVKITGFVEDKSGILEGVQELDEKEALRLIDKNAAVLFVEEKQVEEKQVEENSNEAETDSPEE